MLTNVLIKDRKGDYTDYTAREEGKTGRENAHIRTTPLPAEIGKGSFSTVTISPDLEIGICRGNFAEDYTARITLTTPLVYFGFCLQGKTLTWNSCQPEPVVMQGGYSTVFFFEDPKLTRKTDADQETTSLVIRVNPDYFCQLLSPREAGKKNETSSLPDQIKYGHLHVNKALNTHARTVLFQILNSPYHGNAGRLYMESKAMELMAIQLSQMQQNGPMESEENHFSPRNQEKICHARDLLLQDLQFPPTLAELAKQTGVSHSCLNRGFKKIYGCTVFEYLRRERLAYARELIERDPQDLSMIAYEAGFCSASHFAASFFREYGVTPSEYRKSLRRSCF